MKCFNRDSKCVHDTYSKKDFAIINSQEIEVVNTTGDAFDYPAGFTSENSILVNICMSYFDTRGAEIKNVYNYGAGFDDFGYIKAKVQLANDGIYLDVNNDSGNSKTVKFTLILMKIK